MTQAQEFWERMPKSVGVCRAVNFSAALRCCAQVRGFRGEFWWAWVALGVLSPPPSPVATCSPCCSTTPLGFRVSCAQVRGFRGERWWAWVALGVLSATVVWFNALTVLFNHIMPRALLLSIWMVTLWRPGFSAPVAVWHAQHLASF